MSRKQNWSFLGRITAKASDEFQTNWIFNREHTKQKHQFYRVGDTLKVMFLFCAFSIKDQISLKLVRCFCCYSASTKTRLVSAHAQNFFS